MSFKGQAEKLNEQRIGRFVFGRAEDYDSSADGIVRSQASRLRQRLEQYFAEEGRDEPLQIAIPRGSYVPRFAEREAGEQKRAEEAVVPPIAPGATIALTPAAQERRIFASTTLPWTLAALLTAVLCAVWWHGARVQTASAASTKIDDPLLLRFWSGIFTPGSATLVVTPDSGLVMYQNFSGEHIDLKRYLDGRYRAGVHESGGAAVEPLQPALMLDLANRRYTSIVDVEAILHMKERAHESNSDVQVRYARDLRPNDLKEGNVILLGASSADPWVELFEKDMNFVLQDDYTRQRAVLNRNRCRVNLHDGLFFPAIQIRRPSACWHTGRTSPATTARSSSKARRCPAQKQRPTSSWTTPNSFPPETDRFHEGPCPPL